MCIVTLLPHQTDIYERRALRTAHLLLMLQFQVRQRLLVVRLLLDQLDGHVVQHGLPLLGGLLTHTHSR